MYVCMYAYVHSDQGSADLYVSTADVYMYMYTYLHVYMYTCLQYIHVMHSYIYTCIYITASSLRIHVYMHIRIYVYMYICMYVYT